MIYKLVICFLAGMGAGLGTGFAGMSAAAVISPMLIAFLGMEPYMAVGIALASDVLASAVSAYTYGKNKNLDITDNYGIYLGSEFLDPLKISELTEIIRSGRASNISEAIEVAKKKNENTQA